MKTLIAIFGKSGSGKDSIVSALAERYKYHKVVRITTRAMREGESQGSPYYFVDEKELQEDLMENLGSYLEVGYFNNWLYTTHIDSLEKDINIASYDVGAVENLIYEKQVNIIPIFIHVEDKERVLRLLSRQENPDIEEICRRYFSDKEDYKDINFQYYFVQNSNLENALTEIKNIVTEELDNII